MAEKVEAGVAWYPLEFVKSHFTIGEAVEIHVRRTSPPQSHKFKSGVGCQLSLHGSSQQSYKGTVSFVRKDTMGIILSSEVYSLQQIPSNVRMSVEQIYDERPYQVMKYAVEQVMESDSPRIQYLSSCITDRVSPEADDLQNPAGNYGLNPSQNQALQAAKDCDYISIIHGPPGTGKTTTLVRLIREICETESQVLVCAASNSAVDLLAIRLHEIGLRTLRMGNVTRIADAASELTLAEQARNHSEWGNIKKIRIEAAEARRQAEVYKRKYGQSQRNQRRMLYQESKDLNRWARDLEDKITSQVLDGAQAVCTTLIGLSTKQMRDMRFKTVVIDEASQALEPECWNAILRADRVILAGDHMQLPPTVKSPEALAMGLSETILDRMSQLPSISHLLTVQYRMHHLLHAYSNQRFYDGKLVSHESNHDRKLDDEPLVIIDTSGCGFEEEISEQTLSKSNPGEIFLLEEFLLQARGGWQDVSIGIISPYAQQVRALRGRVESEDVYRGLDVEVQTIDGFQGQEKDVIILSMVRSNDRREIGFLQDERRFNVAITRAKQKLVVIGDFSTLSSADLYEDYAAFAEMRGSYRSGWEYMS